MTVLAVEVPQAPVSEWPATECFGSTCAAYRLGAPVPEVQTAGARKAALHRKEHLPIRCDLLYAVCRRDALVPEERYSELEAP